MTTTNRQPEPGETLHRVVTDCPDVWDELDAEGKAGWAEDEAEVVAGGCAAARRPANRRSRAGAAAD